MTEALNYVSSKEGLTALNNSLAQRNIDDVLPDFVLPVRYTTDDQGGGYFSYSLGSRKSGAPNHLAFYLPKEQIDRLKESIYVVQHKDGSRGLSPYHWLNFHTSSAADTPVLTSCCLRIRDNTHQIDFQRWHGFEEQLLTDYILGLNGLKFGELLPFNTTMPKIGRHAGLLIYHIGGNIDLLIKLAKQELIQDQNVLRFIPRTDNQALYEWIDILKITPELPEERWPLVSSYRILASEHRISSKDWFGHERQLLKDFANGLLNFHYLKPVGYEVRNVVHYIDLWYEEGIGVRLPALRRFNLKLGDRVILKPEKESEEGADFLLVKDGTTLARYRLDLKTKKFSCIDNLTAAEPVDTSIVSDKAKVIDMHEALLLYSSLPKEEAWEVADKYWEYVLANPDCRMDIPEYYVRVYVAEQGGTNGRS